MLSWYGEICQRYVKISVYGQNSNWKISFLHLFLPLWNLSSQTFCLLNLFLTITTLNFFPCLVNSFLSILYLKWNRFFLYILKIQRSEISFFGKINYTFTSSYVASYLLHFLCLRIIFKRRKSWNWRIKSGQTEEKLEARIIEITKKKNYNKTGTQPKLLFRKMSDTALLYRTFDEKC